MPGRRRRRRREKNQTPRIQPSSTLRSAAGGFIFKQWKKRFLLLTAEGALLVCHDASSAPDQLVLLQGGCEAIVEGKEILDLPKLPSGGCRDCCFALILPQSKYLLLLTDTAADCRSGEVGFGKKKRKKQGWTCGETAAFNISCLTNLGVSMLSAAKYGKAYCSEGFRVRL